MALEGLVALLGGLLGGYGQGRQVSIENQRTQAAADQAAREFNIRTALEQAAQTNQQNQFGQDLAFRKQQADVAQKQATAELNSRGIMAYPAFAKGLRGLSPDVASGAVSSFAGAFPGAGLPTTIAPGALGPDLETAKGKLDLEKAASDVEQGYVNAPSWVQNAVGKALNAARTEGGNPLHPVPFDKSGQTKAVPKSFADVLGGVLGGNPDVNPDAKQFDVYNPGFSPSPETAQKLAQTNYVNTEASTLPTKVAAEVLRLRQEGKYKEADLALQAAKIQSENANAAANRAVQINGQNLSAQTAANGQAVARRGQDLTFAGKTADQAAQDRRAAQVQIDQIAGKRDTAQTELRKIQAMLTAGGTTDAKTGKTTPLSDAQRTYFMGVANGYKTQIDQHNTDIRTLKEQSGIINPRDGSTGQFVSPRAGGSSFVKGAARSIKTTSGRTLVATPMN
jgi:hypothetical protein